MRAFLVFGTQKCAGEKYREMQAQDWRSEKKSWNWICEAKKDLGTVKNDATAPILPCG